MDEHLPKGSRTATWLSILALVLGLTLAAASTVVLGSQIWHMKQQLDRQRRTKALVDEVGLPRSFVPKVRSSNRWAIGGSTGLVFGFFWFMWGLVHYRDVRRRSTYTIGEDPRCDHPAPAGALRANEALGLSHITRILQPGLTELGSRVLSGKPLRTTSRATGMRPARKRSNHRRRR